MQFLRIEEEFFLLKEFNLFELGEDFGGVIFEFFFLLLLIFEQLVSCFIGSLICLLFVICYFLNSLFVNYYDVFVSYNKSLKLGKISIDKFKFINLKF